MSLIGEERKKTIMSIIDRRDKVTVGFLSEQLNVSSETVRKYLEELDREKKLKKVYGGAIRLHVEQEELSYHTREIMYYEEKRRIGRKAAEFVLDNDVIAIDEGSTALQMIEHLVHKKNITVCTNSFPVIAVLHKYAEEETFIGNVIFLGGKVSLKHMRVSGRHAEHMMDSFYVDKAFISVDGITLKDGFTSLDVDKAMLSVKMMEQAKETYMLVDHSKYMIRGISRIADLDKVKVVISDQAAPDDWQEELLARDIRWVMVRNNEGTEM